jgi:cell division septum initiation protein DivIVA
VRNDGRKVIELRFPTFEEFPMSDTSPHAFGSSFTVTPAQLRNHDLPVHHFGGYAREATDELLQHAAAALETAESRARAEILRLKADLQDAHQQLSDGAGRSQYEERAVGEAIVTAHRVAEALRAEAKQEADALLASAHAQAAELLQQAEHRASELRAESARVEDSLARARGEAGSAEREIADLRGEAQRVRAVIDDFRAQWWNLISESLRQLELHFPDGERSHEGTETFARDLRDRLVEARASEQNPPLEVVDRPAAPETGSGAG